MTTHRSSLWSSALSNPGISGPIIAIGGAEDRTSDLAILTHVFALSPEDNSEVTVIAAASSIPDQVLPVYKTVFERLGASQVNTLAMQDRSQAADPEAVSMIERSGVIFFTGGDQLNLTSAIGGSPVLKAIRERSRAGAVVAGTSAGAVALPNTMIYGGAAEDALHKGMVHMTSGLGLVDNLMIDSHFLHRGRFTRLMEVGASNPEYLGVGLGEDAGIIIYPNRILEVIGSGHVIILDAQKLVSSNISALSMGESIAVEHMIVHALVSGHGFDIDARRYLNADKLDAALKEKEIS